MINARKSQSLQSTARLRSQLEDAGLPISRSEDIVAAADDQPEDQALPDAFSIKDSNTANWLVRKVMESRAYVEHVAAWAAIETKRAERQERWLMRRFGDQLQSWASAQLSVTGGRRKCVALPAGTVGFRTTPQRMEIVDERAALAWSRINVADAVKTVIEGAGADAEQLLKWISTEQLNLRIHHKLLRSVLAEHFQETGEMPVGVNLGGGGESFYIK